jgi:ADP-heptose:LPS heptosyltransferase
VAAGTRTVSVFGPVDERVYGPYPPEGHLVVKKGVPCQPCYRRFRMTDCGHISCLQLLEVEEVWEAVEKILKI